MFHLKVHSEESFGISRNVTMSKCRVQLICVVQERRFAMDFSFFIQNSFNANGVVVSRELLMFHDCERVNVATDNKNYELVWTYLLHLLIFNIKSNRTTLLISTKSIVLEHHFIFETHEMV